MWKKRKEDTLIEKTPEPARTPAPPAEGPATGTPPSVPRPRVSRPEATIGKTVFIKGQIHSKEDLYLDGQVEGSLELPANRLTVGSNGKVRASIKAREVEILGTVQGDIAAGERIIIRKAANLVGDLKSATISIEDGAYFKGSIDIVKTAPPKVSAAASSPAAPSRGSSTAPGQARSAPSPGPAKPQS